jgi:putative FmdB family regulatory protein
VDGAAPEVETRHGILADSETRRRVSVPLYEYKCLKCDRRTEKIENVAGPHLKKCPHCGGKVEAMISAPAIQFKGSGWYVTDYAGKSAAREAGNKEEKAAADKAEKKDTPAKDSTAKESTAKETSTSEKKTDRTDKSEKSAKKK